VPSKIRSGSDRPARKTAEKTGGLVVLREISHRKGAWLRSAGMRRLEQRGPARVFESEEEAMTAVTSKKIVRRCRRHPQRGAKRRPGMREMLSVTGALRRRGVGILSCAIDRRALQRRDPRDLMAGTRLAGSRAGGPIRRRAPTATMIRFRRQASVCWRLSSAMT